MENPDIIKAVTPVTKAFEELSISYYIGGSIASSLYGIARATLDVDLAATVKQEHVLPFKFFLEKIYYLDETRIREAIQRKSSFNLIHLESMIKIDVFIIEDEPYQIEALRRRRKDTIEECDTSIEFYFSTPEDIILNKLKWYEMGRRASERQWLDVVGVIKVQGNLLDKKYLINWAKKLEIVDLLEKAFHDAGEI